MSLIKTLIIAEAGVNHNGNLDQAFRLIDVAAEAGADMVKFQTFNADLLVTASASKAEYQTRSTAIDESQHAMLRRLELTFDMHKKLISHCNSRQICFFSTGFDSQSIDMLIGLGLDKIKVPSGEITNLPYLRHVGEYGKPVILSTGMANMNEIESALNVLELAGTPREKITVLHCNTEYPTPMVDVNLKAMLGIRDTFGVKVGYSDHTTGIEVAVAAVSLGACVIEKHFTLDRKSPGPDQKASLEPVELTQMVTAIRNIEKALGDGYKRTSLSEEKNKAIVRKSIVAAYKIKAGQLFSDSNLAVKRPGTGPLLSDRFDDVLGKTATRDLEAEVQIAAADVAGLND